MIKVISTEEHRRLKKIEEEHQKLRTELWLAYRWLAEFDDVSDTVEYLLGQSRFANSIPTLRVHLRNKRKGKTS